MKAKAKKTKATIKTSYPKEFHTEDGGFGLSTTVSVEFELGDEPNALGLAYSCRQEMIENRNKWVERMMKEQDNNYKNLFSSNPFD